MLRKLREVNVDHFHVGWYQSTFLGTFLNRIFVESQFDYQQMADESVVIVYGRFINYINHVMIQYFYIKYFTCPTRYYLRLYLSHLCCTFLILTFISPYMDLKKVYFFLLLDPLQTNQGNLSFKAYRLTKKLMELYVGGEKSFTPEG